jgi:hypothetical protein
MKTYPEIPDLVEMEQKYWAPYVDTYVGFLNYGIL